MRIPLSWLNEYVDVSLPPARLAERMTEVGLEVVGVQVLGLPVPEGLRVKAEDRGPVWARDKIMIAEVVKVERHPDADRLSLPTVTWGNGTLKQLVTGAPNIKIGDQGQKVVLALVGSVLFDGHSQEKVLKELKPTKIRGIPSDAMVCSMRELGISDEHEGIILLEDDAPVGMPLADFMGDIVLEVDVLPNMARCLSMIGVAREVAAICGTRLKLPAHEVEARGAAVEGQVRVVIENSKLCGRYAAALIRDVTIGPAPSWMQRRLLYSGMRPISNIVDITNFVMLEWGQPLHAFDYDVLVKRAAGGVPSIIIRSAHSGEVLTTLDGQKRELSPDNLVIADTAGPIALAGVMGGAETEVTALTRNILLESANFDFVSVRRTMKQFNLPSEASVRFSKGIHPETVKPAAERAADLMRLYAGGTVCQGLVDCYPAPLPNQVVELRLPEVKRLLGVEISKARTVSILESLQFTVADRGLDVLAVTVPPHRLDIQVGAPDLIEELARIEGYAKLPATLLADRLPRQQANVPLAFEEHIRDVLVRCGLQEVISYALTMPEKEAPLKALVERDYLRIKNPITSERVVMRQTMLAGVLEAAAANLQHAQGVRLFELGCVYLTVPGESLPAEPRRLALVLTGERRAESWSDSSSTTANVDETFDFFDIKGIVGALLDDLHIAGASYAPSQTSHFHPGKAANISANGKMLGEIGQLHPQVAEAYGLAGRAVLAAELDVDALQAAVPVRSPFTPVPRFPAALRDIAVVVADNVSAARVADEIRTAGGELLSGVRLFDLYKGDSIPAGTKSLAYALTFQAGNRTLTDKEVDKAHKKIADRLKHVLKASIRGEETSL